MTEADKEGRRTNLALDRTLLLGYLVLLVLLVFALLSVAFWTTVVVSNSNLAVGSGVAVVALVGGLLGGRSRRKWARPVGTATLIMLSALAGPGHPLPVRLARSRHHRTPARGAGVAVVAPLRQEGPRSRRTGSVKR